ncbi:UNVERIFIED_ORG: phosphoglycerol transferase MdoB-like AlkP superfamily enzyme [Bacillus proteolyticus]
MLQHLFPKLRFALVAVVLLWIKTYIVYKLAFDIKIDNFFEEFMLFINPLAALLLFFGLALLASKHRNRINNWNQFYTVIYFIWKRNVLWVL